MRSTMERTEMLLRRMSVLELSEVDLSSGETLNLVIILEIWFRHNKTILCLDWWVSSGARLRATILLGVHFVCAVRLDAFHLAFSANIFSIFTFRGTLTVVTAITVIAALATFFLVL